jgi:colicin import membrane protein
MTRHMPFQKPLVFSILLHVVVFCLLIVSFEWQAPMPVLKNSDKIIDAMLIEETITPSNTVQDIPKVVEPKPTPTPVKVEPKPTPTPAPPKTESVVIPKNDPKIKEALIQKQLLEDLQKEKIEQKKKQQKAVQNALLKEMQDLHDETARENALQEQKRLQNLRAQQMQGIVDKYKALILQTISRHWLIPPQINKKLSAELFIRLAPGGVVLDVQLTKSSGDVALDRSARDAVFKASPLPVPNNTDEFEAFRQFVLKVKPENIAAM